MFLYALFIPYCFTWQPDPTKTLVKLIAKVPALHHISCPISPLFEVVQQGSVLVTTCYLFNSKLDSQTIGHIPFFYPLAYACQFTICEDSNCKQIRVYKLLAIVNRNYLMVHSPVAKDDHRSVSKPLRIKGA